MRTRIGFALIVSVIVCIYLMAATEKAFSQQVQYQMRCGVGGCQMVPVAPVVAAVPVVPQQVMVPRVTYQPYQYQGSVVARRYYHTPIRNWLFGRYRGYHYYAPVKQ